MTELFDHAAEAVVIGALLGQPTERHELFQQLDVSDFHDPLAQQAFAAIDWLHDHGQPVSIKRVTERANDLDWEYLVHCQQQTQPTGRYTSRLVELSERRRLQGFAVDTSIAALDEDQDPWSSWEEAADRITLARMAMRAEGWGVPRAKVYWTDDHIPVDWLVPGVMERRTRSVLIGPSGYGKSMALRQFGFCTSQGLHPFREGVAIPPIRVAQFEMENGLDLVERRLQLIRQRIQPWLNLKQIKENRDNHYLVPLQRNVNLLGRADRRALEWELTNFRPDLVIIGPIYRAYTPGGKGDMGGEQAAAQMQDFLDDILHRYEHSQLWEAHSPKSDPLTIRGSAAWTNWCDYAMALVPQGETSHSWLVPIRGGRGDGAWPDALEKDMDGHYPWTAVPRRNVFEDEDQDQYR